MSSTPQPQGFPLGHGKAGDKLNKWMPNSLTRAKALPVAMCIQRGQPATLASFCRTRCSACSQARSEREHGPRSWRWPCMGAAWPVRQSASTPDTPGSGNGTRKRLHATSGEDPATGTFFPGHTTSLGLAKTQGAPRRLDWAELSLPISPAMAVATSIDGLKRALQKAVEVSSSHELLAMVAGWDFHAQKQKFPVQSPVSLVKRFSGGK